MAKSKMSKKQVFSIATAAATLIANIVVVLLLVWTFKYVGLATSLFYSLFGIAICLLIIVDIIFFVGFNNRDNLLKTITCVLALILVVGGGVGTYYIGRVNSAVDNIVSGGDGDQYEVIRVSIATYDNSSIKTIEDLKGKNVGSLNNTGVSAASVGRDYLTEKGVDVNYKSYNMTSDLYQALIEGEIDAAIFPNTYRSQLKSSDEAYEKFLEKTTDIENFEKRVVTTNSSTSSIDISVEPFTILLIGYAPEEGGGGLTDTIILASVNPQTLQATMVSIPRDSYVPISCYNNARSKINDAGAASKACLMETVSNLLDVDVDFYMEVNFQGLVDIVDALGGIYINSPVEFVGQSASSSRGDYTVWVPAGEYKADGEQALAFARERHAMPNGDFDRQIHQQQVISEIVRSFMNLRDINAALAVMDAAGENFSTNLSINQLTSIFNYMLTAPNYAGIPQFNLLSMQSSRVTGYTRWFYSYSMHLPLWSYYLWQGSIDDNVALLDETLGDFKSINQDSLFQFFVEYPYDRGPLYFEYYPETKVPEDMPPYYPRLAGMSYDEVVAWASANGVGLNVVSINEGETGYDENSVGLVVDQSVPYGSLVADYPTVTITVIGTPLSDSDRVPNFVGLDINKVYDWANNNGYSVVENIIANSDNAQAGKVTLQDISAGSNKNLYDTITVEYYEIPTISVSELENNLEYWSKDDVIAWASRMGITNYGFEYVESNLLEGTVVSFSARAPYTTRTYFVFYIAKEVELPTCGDNASLSGGECKCNEGYEGNPNTGCTLIPVTPPEVEPPVEPVDPQPGEGDNPTE